PLSIFTSTHHHLLLSVLLFFLFFFHATPTTDIYTLSLHDALPICEKHTFSNPALYLGLFRTSDCTGVQETIAFLFCFVLFLDFLDRKSTRLNSSHVSISYAVFCLKKKKYKSVISVLYVLLFVVLSV